MGFADRYLQKHSTPGAFIGEKPSGNLKGIIIIPAYRESGLHKCLDSLFQMDPVPLDIEIIVFINLPEKSSPDTIKQHRELYLSAIDYARVNKRKGISCHVIMESNLPAKYFGAGLARKLVMDEAIKRFNQVNNPSGVILSLDADTRVEKNYAAAVINQFAKNPGTEGCAIHFEHPTEGNDFPPEVYAAITNYELHQRYYLSATRYTGYPYAFHTVGSCFAVKAATYCKQGGMSRRQAGEDFYFIQKVAMNGNFKECNTTTVHPSPRPSDRVPFGTGPAIIKQLQHPDVEFCTYNPKLFFFLKAFYDRIDDLFRSENTENCLEGLHSSLRSYLEETGFTDTLAEIKGNVSDENAFRKRFFRNFNWLWLLKYLHFAEEHGIEKIPVARAITELLKRFDLPVDDRDLLPGVNDLSGGDNDLSLDIADKKKLLQYLRQLHTS